MGKIFEMTTNYSDDKDWVFAESEDDAIEFYCNEINATKDEIIIVEIPESKWSEFYFLDANEYYDDEAIEESGLDEDDFLNGYKITSTFADYVKDLVHPEIIASSEY
jgi:hypothetical protein